MDWAVGQGYASLYDSTSKRESAKNELGMLQVMDQQMKADKAEKETDDLKEQAYYEQISKFSDTLLGPDKQKINQNAASMAAIVREQIKVNGGDMSKFFANGGHKILGQYKSAVLNSDEASTYKENKVNMDRIVEMQMKGFGHRINARDLAALDQYQKDGTGKITYTGMLNEIDVPDLNGYYKGETVPTSAILNNKENYIKFLGNYKMTYPDAKYPPEQQELERFVNQSHGKLKGTNISASLQKEKLDFDKVTNVRDFNENRRQWNETFAWNKEKEYFDQEFKMNELEAKSGGGTGGSGLGKGMVSDAVFGAMSEEEKKAYIDGRGAWAFDIQNMITDIGYNVKDSNGVNDRMWDKYAAYFGKKQFERNNDKFDNMANQGAGLYFTGGKGFINEGVRKLVGDRYSVKGSKKMFTGSEANSLIKSSGLLPMDEKGVIKLDLNSDTDLFMQDGSKYSDQRNAKGPLSGLISKDYHQRVAKQNFKVTGVVTGFAGRDKQGNEIMLMNPDGKKAAKDYNERIDGKYKASPSLFIALRSEDGDVIHKKIDGNSQMALMNQWAGANVNTIKNARTYGAKNAATVRMGTAQQKADAVNVYNQFSSDPKYSAKIQQQARMVPGGVGKGNKFAPLAMSYYVALNSANNGVGTPAELLQTNAFNDLMSHIGNDDRLSKEFKNLTNNPRTDDRAIVDFLVKNKLADSAFGDAWKNTMQFVKYAK